MAQGTFLEAATSFTIQVEDAPVFVSEGELWEADDRVVKGREHLFRQPTIRSTATLRTREQRRARSAVETTTAAPGESRTLSGPPERPAAATPKPTTSGRPRAGATASAAEPSEV